jgi:hypothetical protein
MNPSSRLPARVGNTGIGSALGRLGLLLYGAVLNNRVTRFASECTCATG